MNKVRSYIGLGSNINSPINQVKTAMYELANMCGVLNTKNSSLYQTSPVGFGAQKTPDFINAVVELEIALSPLELLAQLQCLEKQHGRILNQPLGPRSLDLDILLYGNHKIKSDNLIIPHPGLYKRQFVLQPLAELNPKLVLPNGEMISQYIVISAEEPQQQLLTEAI